MSHICLTLELVEESERDVFVVEGEDDAGSRMINSLGQLHAVEIGQDAVGVAHEVLVDEVDELVLGRVLHLIVVLGLSECGEVLGSLELVEVDVELTGHALAGHGLPSVPEEVEVVHATHHLQVMHDALTDQVCLL